MNEGPLTRRLRRRAWPLAGRARVAVTSLVFVIITAVPAAACPDCAEGRQARADVYGADFTRQLMILLVPFLLIGAVCSRVERIGKRSRAPGSAGAASRAEGRRDAPTGGGHLRLDR